MSKGKKKNYNKPILPVKVGGIKVPPPKPPKKVKKKKPETTPYVWDKAALKKMVVNFPEPTVKARQNGFYQLAQQPQVFNYLDPKVNGGVDPGWFLQEYTADVEPDKIKKPTVDDWAEEWYEKQKKLG